MEKIKIVLIEDDQILSKVLNEELSDAGFEMTLAFDGEEGLAKIKSVKPDLVLLDIMLPRKDGLQVMRDLKVQPPQKNNGSIVVLTNLGQDAIIKECFNLGADGYLIKSALNPDEVLTEVKSYLEKNNAS